MSRRTLFLILALFIITLTLLMMVVYQPQSPKTTSTVTPTVEPVAQTVLSFGVPEIATTSSTTTLNYSLPVNISTGKNKVSAIQLEMQYDPLLLTNVKVTADSFFAKPVVLIDQIDAKTGRISYAFGIGPADQGIMGSGKVATLTFSTKVGVPEKTAIIFLPKTLVTAEGVAESVLKEAKLGQFTIGIDSPTPSAATK
jgi:hypothetical protein